MVTKFIAPQQNFVQDKVPHNLQLLFGMIKGENNL